MKPFLLSVTTLGFLIGMMVGMSASPVTGAVLSALASAALFFVGNASGGKEKPAAQRQPPPWACWGVTVFSAAVIIATLLGVYWRTHNTFGKSLNDLKRELAQAGLSESEMKPYIVAGLLNAPNESADTKQASKSGGVSQGSVRLGVLYSGTPNDDDWSRYDPRQFKGDARKVRDYWKLAENTVWPLLARLSEMVPEDKQFQAMVDIYDKSVPSKSK